ncbi:unnamed protein product [Didymodactylos carnosus]|uniref:Uncharacterized protein n=2 Tax=Didymodactylos carnosus TaxID=1234261 RepID=A0A813SLZ8_9BILA|nr:unnamed protein product [Didymodactylos carnosus]CAF3581746.1 unnamed protein product [Didymodactylos carnosus]
MVQHNQSYDLIHTPKTRYSYGYNNDQPIYYGFLKDIAATTTIPSVLFISRGLITPLTSILTTISTVKPSFLAHSTLIILICVGACITLIFCIGLYLLCQRSSSTSPSFAAAHRPEQLYFLESGTETLENLEPMTQKTAAVDRHQPQLLAAQTKAFTQHTTPRHRKSKKTKKKKRLFHCCVGSSRR